jgi:hypothetical protein
MLAPRLIAIVLVTACTGTLYPDPNGGGGEESGSGAAMSPDAGVPDTPPPAETALDQELLAQIMNYAQFAHISASPYTSSVGAFDIAVYAQGDVRTYRSIHPTTTATSSITVAAGTMIVRTVLDANGNVSELTAIAKAPAGYDPTIDDWWFAETDTQGNPIVSGGVPQYGRLDGCHTCHLPRATEDYLFGVPANDETEVR